VEPEFLEDAIEILRWVVWASRPLNLQELAIAIAIRPEHTSMSTLWSGMETDLRRVLLSTFGPLLRVQEDGTVHLVHQSAKDFLSNPKPTGEGFEYNTELHPPYQETNLHIAIHCLIYLSFEEFEIRPPIRTWYYRDVLKGFLHDNPFLAYSGKHWPEHMARAGAHAEESHEVQVAFMNMANSEQKLNLAHQLFAFSESSLFHNASSLEIAACFGFTIFIHVLLRCEDRAGRGNYNQALCMAISWGHCEVVRLLLEHGADANAKDSNGPTALHFAVKSSLDPCIQLVTNPGAAVGDGRTDGTVQVDYDAIVSL
jgi:hypothetical protein